jgi:hypothetical protein
MRQEEGMAKKRDKVLIHDEDHIVARMGRPGKKQTG